MTDKNSAKPSINVTPLIDVLLVLLIIFMLISPLKSASFKAKVPAERQDGGEPNPLSLVVTINPDLTLKINKDEGFGTVSEPQKLIDKLSEAFATRERNGTFKEGTNEVEKTVFIKAPRNIPYGEVVKVVDAMKLSGAAPMGLQIDDLE